MRTVFLSFHFGDSDRELARQAEGILESHGLRITTGEDLGGGALTPGVMAQIAKADALVALMTKRSEPPDYGGTHPWVVNEFGHAVSLGKPAIALVDQGVTIAGAYQNYERIDYDPAHPLKAFLKLSKIIGIWRERAGRLVKVRLLPAEVADKVAASNTACLCKYRLYESDGTLGAWSEAVPVPEGDGAYLFLKGIKDDMLIQVRVEVGGSTWTSRALAQALPIPLLPN